jgi:hypothetical protein
MRIESHIAVADVLIGSNFGADDFSRAMFAVKTARFHPVAYGRVERAAALRRQNQCEPHRFVEYRARGDGSAGQRGELHQLALRFESRAALFDFVKPAKRALNRRFSSGADDVNRHQRAHRDLGVDGQGVRSLRFA